MGARVAVVGASGYGGAELLRLLAGHPELRADVVAAHARAGEALDTLFPNLPAGRRLDAIDPDELRSCDLVFLATPHGASLDLAPPLVDAGVPVVDLSGAFRLDADAFAAWYGERHPRPDLAPAVYGLTEHRRAEVADAVLVANPGCYPTAAALALTPLRPLVDPAWVVVDAVSGTSGAGRGLRDSLHHSHVHGDVTPYGAPTHRHTPEIERAVGLEAPISFTPHLAPMARGLLATCHAALRDGVTPDDVRAALREAYDDEPFVRVLPPGRFPDTKALTGSNGAHVGAAVDERTGRVLVTCAIDNLGKGAAGQALQNANVMLGLPETTGLTAVGVYP